MQISNNSNTARILPPIYNPMLPPKSPTMQNKIYAINVLGLPNYLHTILQDIFIEIYVCIAMLQMTCWSTYNRYN